LVVEETAARVVTQMVVLKAHPPHSQRLHQLAAVAVVHNGARRVKVVVLVAAALTWAFT
jgi:hypothetical protein